MSRSLRTVACLAGLCAWVASARAQTPDAVVRTIEDRGHVTVMELNGVYDHQPEATRDLEFEIREAVAKEFFRTHPDDYDFLVVFTKFPFSLGTEGVKGRYYAIRNDVQGIGQPLFDHSADFGSAGRLQAYIDAGTLARLAIDPTDPRFEQTLSLLVHELQHRWGSHVRFRDAGGAMNTALLGLDQAHWSALVQSYNSVMYGSDWRDNGNGTFTAVGRSRSFLSPLDLYLMGVLPQSDVPPFFLIDNPAEDATRLPEIGRTIAGVARAVTIDDIIAAEGERVPAAADAQKRFKLAFLYLVRPGQQPDGADLAGIEAVREAFATRLAILTGGKATVEIFAEPQPEPLPPVPPILPPSSGQRTKPVDLTEATHWLLSRQAATGAWLDSSSTAVRDTAAAIDLLQGVPEAFMPSQKGLAWLAGFDERASVDTVARRLAAIAPQFSAPDRAFLMQSANAAGGWGLAGRYTSDPFDTALALHALGDPARAADLAYLLGSQNQDGGWALRPGGPSSILGTLAVLKLHGRYTSSQPLNDAFARGEAWLRTQQRPDGGFGDAASTAYETAEAVLFLLETTFPRSDLVFALDFLNRLQLADGSWNESVYETALAVRALRAAARPNVALIGSSLQAAPADPVDGASVTISAQIANDGAQDLSSVVVRFYDGDPALGGGPIGGDVLIASLTRFSSEPVSIVWDTTDKPGDHLLFVLVDPDGQLDEFNERDNAASLPIVVRPPPVEPDLAVSPGDLALAPPLLQSLPQEQMLTATVSNAGQTAAPAVTVWLYDGDPATGGEKIGEAVAGVPGRGRAAVSFSFTVGSAGDHAFVVVVDPQNSVVEADEANNRATVPLPTQATLDFFVVEGSVALSENPIALSETLTITAQIGNGGTTGAFAIPVRFAIEDPAGAIEIATLTVDLAAGETRSVSATWRAGRALQNVPVAVTIDPANTRPERSELNNRAAAPLTVPASTQPNLHVTHTELQVSSPVLQRGSATIEVPVHNTGAAGVSDVGVTFYLGIPGSGGVPIAATQTIPAIAAGGQVLASATWADIAVNGERLVYVVVDEAGTIDEFDEGDNQAFVTVAVLSSPDLAVSGGALAFVPPFPKSGDAVSMSATISNTGQQPASNVLVRFVDGAPAGGTLIGEQVLAHVPPGGTAAAQVLLPGSATAGARTISVIVDPSGEIVELREDNNTASRTLGVQDASLWFSNLYFSPNGDGLQDDTELFFRLEGGRAAAAVAVRNRHGDDVRLFALEPPADAGSVTWDGLDAEGRLVPDGEYTLTLRAPDDGPLASAHVTIDNNASPVGDAFGTKYLLEENLTCTMKGTVGTGRFGPIPTDYVTAGWLPDDGGLVRFFPTQAVCTQPGFSNAFPCAQHGYVEFPVAGVYVVSPEGQSTRITPDNWAVHPPVANGVRIFRVDSSPDGGRLLITLLRYRPVGGQIEYVGPREYWVVNSDGSGLRLAGTIPTSTLQSGTSEALSEAFWSPDNLRVAVQAFDPAVSQYGVYAMQADGTGQRLIDTTQIQGVTWSPDSTRIFYARGNTVRVAPADGSGPPEDVFGAAQFADVSNVRGWVWFSGDRFLAKTFSFSTGGRLSLFSASGGPGQLLVDDAEVDGPVLDPAAHVAAYAPAAGGAFSSNTAEQRTTGLFLVDAGGEPRQVYTASPRNQGIRNIRWSRDGQRLVFLEDITTEHKTCSGDGTFFCGTSYLVLVSLSLRDGAVRTFPITEPVEQERPGSSFPLRPLTLVPDGESYLFSETQPGTTSTLLVGISTSDGSRAAMSLGSGVDLSLASFSPSGKYFRYRTFSIDDRDPCWKGYVAYDDHVLSSLLNLTAQFTFQRDGSQLVVRGIAEDRHFARYVLEYAPVETPEAWAPLGEPSDASAINATLARWVPPAEGTFYVRITAEDKAGNRLRARRRITWGLTPTITNIVVKPRIFSPNGDGVHDSVTVDYVVLGPVHLVFEIHDEGDALVRTILQDHDVIGPASIAWDGRDDAGLFVPDGVYRIHVLDYDFFVDVDRTPPEVSSVIGGALHQERIFDFPRWLDVVAEPYHVISGRAVDTNLARWVLETGVGQAPAEWLFLDEDAEALLGRDAGGVPLSPVQDGDVRRIDDLEEVVGRRFRISAEDQAGNRTVAVTDFAPAEIVVHAWDAGRIPVNQVIDAKRGPHVITAVHTSRVPLQAVRVQYRIQGSLVWQDGPALVPQARTFDIPWDTTTLTPGRTHDVRLAGSDLNGGVVLSNVFSIHSDLFELTGYNAVLNLTFGTASVRETQVVVRLVEALPGDREIGTAAITVATATTFEIGVARDDANQTCVGTPVPARLKGTGSSDRIYYSNTLTVIRPPNPGVKPCNDTTDPSGPASLLLTVATVPAAACGLPAPGLVDVSLVDLMLDRQAIVPGSQTLAIQDVPNGALRDVPVATLPFTMRLDTSTRPEGSYIVRATWRRPTDSVIGSAIGTFVVDRTPPAGQLTYPVNNQTLCPARSGASVSVPIEGRVDDPNFDHYEVEYGFGAEPTEWTPFFPTPLEYPASRQPKVGTLATLNVTGLPGGTYTVRLKVYDKGGNLTCRTVTFSFDNVVRVEELAPDVGLFSPNGDGRRDGVTFSYGLNRPARVTGRVFAVSGGQPEAAPLRTLFVNVQQLAGSNSFVWDGRTDLGTVVPDGEYLLQLSATDACDNAVTESVRVRVDTTLPEAVITAPLPAAAVGVTVDVRGTVADLNFDRYTVEVGAGAAPATWTTVGSGFAPLQERLLGTWMHDSAPGPHTIRLIAMDLAGNEREARIDVEVPDVPPLVSALAVNPPLFSPNADGRLETTSVSVEMGADAHILVDVVDGNDALVRRLQDGNVPAATFEYAWDGMAANGQRAADGEYHVRLTATSTADPNRTQTERTAVRVDTTPPALAFDAPANASHVSGAVSVRGSVSDSTLDSYLVEYGAGAPDTTLDEGRQGRSAYEFGVLRELADGVYTVRISARDLAENSAVRSVSVTVDTTAPVATLMDPAGGALIGGAAASAPVRGTVTETHLRRWTLRAGAGADPAVWTDIASGAMPIPDPAAEWMLASVPDGDHTLSLLAEDLAGATGEARTPVIVDRTPPAAVIAEPAEGARITGGASIIGEASDAHFTMATVEIGDGPAGTASRFSSLATLGQPVANGQLATLHTPPADGIYTIRLTVEDALGLKSVVLRTIRIDTQPPPAPLGLTAQLDSRSSPRLQWNASTEPELAGYHVYRNGVKITGTVVAGTEYLDAAPGDGAHAYTVTAVDLAGLESERSNEARVQVDLTAPATKLQAPAANAVVSGLIDIRGTAAAPDDFKEYRVLVATGGAPGPFTTIRRSPQPTTAGVLAQHDTIALPEGSLLTIRLESDDLLGNTASDQVTVTIDNMPPAAPALLSATPSASDILVQWQANTEADLAGYLLYNGDLLANARRIVTGSLAPYTITGTTFTERALADGSYEYTLLAIDRAGNISAPAASLSVDLDTRAPRATVVSPATNTRTEQPILLVATVVDLDVAQVQFQFKAAAEAAWTDLGGADTAAPYTVTWDPSGLAHGTYEFRAVATDTHTQTDGAPPPISIVYQDLTPPPVPEAARTSVTEANVTVTWNAVSADDLAGYRIYRQVGTGSPVAVFAMPIAETTYTDVNVVDGAFTYTVRAVDTAGNESTASIGAAARVYGPTLTAAAFCVSEPDTSITGSGAEPGSAVTLFVDTLPPRTPFGTVFAAADGTFAFDEVPLIAGVNSFVAQAVDGAGNVSRVSATAQISFTAATGAPANFAASVNGFNVALTWDAAPNVFRYIVLRNGVPIMPAGFPPLIGTPTASSSPASAVNANDNNALTYWQPLSSDASPWWLIDFGAPKFVKQVQIDFQNFAHAADFDVQRSDGTGWITILTVRNNAAVRPVLNVPVPAQTSRLRISIIRGVFGLPSSVRLVEVRVYQPTPIAGTALTDFGAPNGTHTYAVRGMNLCGAEGPAAELEVAVGDVTPPARVEGVTATAAGSDVTVQWTPSPEPDVIGYFVERHDGTAWIRVNVAPIAATPLVDALRPNGEYRYRVIAVDVAQNLSDASDAASVTVNVPVPMAPTQLSVTAPPAGGSLDLVWIPGTTQPIAGYRLVRAETAGGPYTPVGGLIAATTYRDEDVTSGVTYFYVVHAADAAGNLSNASNEASGTPRDTVRPDPPLLRYPTDAAHPITVEAASTPVGGAAEPASTVLLLQQGVTLATTVAEPQTVRLRIDLPGQASANQAFHPSGLVASRLSTPGVANSLAVTDLRTGETTRYPSVTQADHPAFSPDARFLAYVVFENGYRLVVFDRSRGAVVHSHAVALAPRDLVFGPAGDRIAFLSGNGVWTIDVASGAQTRVGTFTGLPQEPVWSPSGRELVFRPDFTELAIVDLVTGSLRAIADALFDPPVFAPDGSLVFFSSAGLQRYDLATGTQAPLAVSEPEPRFPAFSRDGRLAYLAFRPDGSAALLLHDAETGESVVLADVVSGQPPQWAVDDSIVELGGTTIHRTLLAGRIWFEDVSLLPGANALSAIAIDAAGNTSDPADPIVIVRETASLPDLAIEQNDLFVHPQYAQPGEQVTVAATVRNVGSAPAADVTVVFLATAESGAADVIGAVQTIPVLAPGATAAVAVAWDTTGLSGVRRVSAVVDHADTIAEASEGNNRVSRDSVISAGGAPVLAVRTDQVTYSPAGVVRVTVDASSPGPPADFTLDVRIEDVNGFEAATLLHETLPAFGSASRNVSLTWPAATVLGGVYRVHAILGPVSGAAVEALAAFVVQTEVSASATVTTDRASYDAGERVRVRGRIANTSANADLANLDVVVQIVDTQGAEMSRATTPVSALLLGMNFEVTHDWDAAHPGAFSARLSVQAESGELATATATFSVAGRARLEGGLGVSPTVVAVGQPFVVTAAVANSGTLDVAGATLRLLVNDAASQLPVDVLERQLDLVTGASLTWVPPLASASLGRGGYSLVLQSDVAGVVDTLASATVTVADRQAPIVAIESPASSQFFNAPVAVIASAADDSSGIAAVEIQADEGAWARMTLADPVTGRYTYLYPATAATEGTRVLRVRAIDHAGNDDGTSSEDLNPVSVSVTIDVTAPAVTVTGVEDGAVYDTAVTPAFSVADAGVSNITALLNGAPFSTGTTIDVDGAYTLAVSATDQAGNSASQSVSFTIERNRPPVASPAALETAEDTPVAVTLAASDPDGDVLSYAVAAPAHGTLSGEAPALTYAPDPDFNGVDEFSFTASDGQASSSATIVVTVAPVNDRPVARTGADQTVSVGDLVTLDGSGSVDPDGDALGWNWSQVAGVEVALSGADTARPTFTAPDVATDGAVLTFRLVVSDGEAESDAVVVNVFVKRTNQAPVADAGVSRHVTSGEAVTLDGSASYDPDGDALAYRWTQITGVPVDLAGTDTTQPSFTAPFVSAPAVLTFELTVTDGPAESVDTVDITIEPTNNHAPVARAGPDQVKNERTTVRLDGRASTDSDGHALAYRWTQTAGAPVTLSSAVNPNPSFKAPNVTFAGETLTFALVVSDGYVDSAPDVVNIRVVDPATGPFCADATVTPNVLWPPNHGMVTVSIGGLAAPGVPDDMTLVILRVFQDEPVIGTGSGDVGPDAIVDGTAVSLRAERSGSGNGRVYRVRFKATRPDGQSCEGNVYVQVRRNANTPAVDEGPLYRSESVPYGKER